MVKHFDTFKGLASPIVPDGKTIIFWHDLWEGRIRAHHCPELMSFALYKNITLHQVRQADNFSELFHLPLSIEAYEQFQIIEQQLDQLDLTDQEDHWQYIWDNGSFSAQKPYKVMTGHGNQVVK